MYGDYFDGQRCAEFCLASYKPVGASINWAPMPDCNEPETVDQFLKALPDASRDPLIVDPISQALKGPSNSGRYSSGQQNTLYNSKSGAEFKGVDRTSWKKRINSKIGSIPRWYFL